MEQSHLLDYMCRFIYPRTDNLSMLITFIRIMWKSVPVCVSHIVGSKMEGSGVHRIAFHTTIIGIVCLFVCLFVSSVTVPG